MTNTEKQPVTLTTFASAMVPIRRGDVWMSSFYGSWANEARLVEEPLTAGQKQIVNKDGTRNAHTSHAEVMFSLDGKARENAGQVIGAALCYAGNYRLKVVTDDTEYHYFFAGINEDNSEYHLKKGETFVFRVSPEEGRDIRDAKAGAVVLGQRTLGRVAQFP